MLSLLLLWGPLPAAVGASADTQGCCRPADQPKQTVCRSRSEELCYGRVVRPSPSAASLWRPGLPCAGFRPCGQVSWGGPGPRRVPPAHWRGSSARCPHHRGLLPVLTDAGRHWFGGGRTPGDTGPSTGSLQKRCALDKFRGFLVNLWVDSHGS